jgi:hypothetical protein
MATAHAAAAAGTCCGAQEACERCVDRWASRDAVQALLDPDWRDSFSTTAPRYAHTHTAPPPQLSFSVLNLAMIVFSALMMWKALMVVTRSESPVVVVLSGSMEPSFQRGDILLLDNTPSHMDVGAYCWTHAVVVGSCCRRRRRERGGSRGGARALACVARHACLRTAATRALSLSLTMETSPAPVPAPPLPRPPVRLPAGDIVVFKIAGRDVPIVHRVLRRHAAGGSSLPANDTAAASATGIFSPSLLFGPNEHLPADDGVAYLTKGDNNNIDDRNLYATGQLWLSRREIVGRAVAYCPYVGMVTILLNDYPALKYVLVGLMGLFVLTGKEA